MREEIIKKELKNNIPITDKKFREIVKFYLFESPVDNVSYRGNTFYEKGWRGARFNTLKKILLDSAITDLRNNYYPSDKKELEINFKKCEKLSTEYCVFLKHDNRNVIPSLFGAIRNAFAHGSFDVRHYKGEKIYFFANYKTYLKAKIVLTETTLLKWIDVFGSVQ